MGGWPAAHTSRQHNTTKIKIFDLDITYFYCLIWNYLFAKVNYKVLETLKTPWSFDLLKPLPLITWLNLDPIYGLKR